MATAPKSRPTPKVPPAKTSPEKFDEFDETDPEPITDADEPSDPVSGDDGTPEAGSPAVDPVVTVTAPAQNASFEGSTAADDNKPPKGKGRSIADRVKDIETRWEKSIQEVMVELHDHVFGASQPHEVTTAQRKEAEKAKAEDEKKKISDKAA